VIIAVKGSYLKDLVVNMRMFVIKDQAKTTYAGTVSIFILRLSYLKIKMGHMKRSYTSA
jgi:hypothetical protein